MCKNQSEIVIEHLGITNKKQATRFAKMIMMKRKRKLRKRKIKPELVSKKIFNEKMDLLIGVLEGQERCLKVMTEIKFSGGDTNDKRYRQGFIDGLLIGFKGKEGGK